ncbi:phasin family protein [Roseixanthobacter glucoisosaccharinicivorans]|uniref:phasin family protein n=1 Tax=Roseixanthobacter glucoisosaccharinicivorans TaxID=3119923 RepID=UPI00372A5F4C
MTDSDAAQTIATPVREAAKAGLAGAHKATDNLMQVSKATLETWQEVNDLVQTATNALVKRGLTFVESSTQNVFEYAQSLAAAQNPQDIVRLQSTFASRQVALAEEQVKAVGEIVRAASRISSVQLGQTNGPDASESK